MDTCDVCDREPVIIQESGHGFCGECCLHFFRAFHGGSEVDPELILVGNGEDYVRPEEEALWANMLS